MTQDVTGSDRGLVSESSEQEDDAASTWGVRGVDQEIRHRMKVQSVLKRVPLGVIVERLCREWLTDGAPWDRQTSERVA